MPESRSRLTARKVQIKDVIAGNYYQQEGFDPNYIITPYGLRVSRARILGTVVDTYINDDESYGAVTIDDGSETIRAKFFQDLGMMEDAEEGDIVEVIGKVKKYDDEIYVNPELILPRSPNYELLRAVELKEVRDQWREYVEKVKQYQDADRSEDDILEEMKAEGLSEDDTQAILNYISLGDDFASGGQETSSGGANITSAPAAETHPTAGDEDSETDTSDSDEDDESDIDEDKRTLIIETIDELDEGDGADYGTLVEETGIDEEEIEDTVNDLLSDGTCYEPRPGRIKKL